MKTKDSYMKSLSGDIFHLLLVFYCVFGLGLISKYVFNHELSGVGLGLVAAAIFMSAYPIFGWKRDSPWERLGRWSLAKWALFGVGYGVMATAVDYFLRMIVHHFRG
jgi:hypothetical protein